MKITNFEVNRIIQILSAEDSIINNVRIKLPHAARHALRMNFKAINDVMEVYRGEIKDIVERYTADGKAKIKEDGSFEVNQDAISDINREFAELAAVENDINLELLDREVIDKICETVDMSIPEENILELFAKKGE